MRTIKYFIIALLFVGCSKDDTSQETDLSGNDRGTVLVTDLNGKTEVREKLVIVLKESSGYIVGNYSEAWPINSNGYGLYVYDQRQDPVRNPEAVGSNDYFTIRVEVTIKGKIMSIKESYRAYTLPAGEVYFINDFEGELRKL